MLQCLLLYTDIFDSLLAIVYEKVLVEVRCSIVFSLIEDFKLFFAGAQCLNAKALKHTLHYSIA
jgi:hypothetical protein